MIEDILLLGNPKLYEVSESVNPSELIEVKEMVHKLHETLMDYRSYYGAGRAIAAPQIGYMKRLIYMHVDRPLVMINPVLEFPDMEQMDVLDDCMSFPTLYVKLKRYKRCQIKYYDENWTPCSLFFEDDLSELIQHEYDHLDGILATMRAEDAKAFVVKPMLKR